jgi:methionyl-tRNA synthetase
MGGQTTPAPGGLPALETLPAIPGNPEDLAKIVAGPGNEPTPYVSERIAELAQEPPAAQITFEDFLKVDIRVGKILTCERVPKSKKLIKMDVDFGPLGKRVIGAGIAEDPAFKPEALLDLHALFVVNLLPRTLMGFESHGMLLSVKRETGFYPVLCSAEAGSKIG